jgi:hypothetical protein
MKNISLGLVILPLLIVSCTTDSIENTDSIDNKVIDKKSEKYARLVQILTPENPENVYDLAGKLHNDILDIYLAGNYQHNAIVEISQEVEAIAAVNNDLMLLNLETNLPIDLNEIQEIINNPQAQLDEAIANSSMTDKAKGSLSNFMTSLLSWENDEYAEIHQSIILYESSVMTNPQFSSEDKRIILTTSSIARYSLYYARERTDKDWEASVGNRAGAFSGAINNSYTAVSRSLVTGIMIHNLVAD